MEEVKEKKAAHPAASRMSDILYVVTGFGTGYLGSMDHPKALGDLVESLVGAVFCDSGFNIAKTYPVRPWGFFVSFFTTAMPLQSHCL